MATASGIFKKLAYKAETTYGTAPSAAGAQYLRRVTSSLDLTKDTYQSNEIREDQQMADFRHGVRRVAGNINGEVSPGTYEDFMAALLKKVFVATTAITGAGLTIAGTGPYTVTRSAGSWLTDGIKVGDVVRLSVGTLHANNINKNLLVVDITSATVMSVIVLNATVMQAEGPITGCTITVIGKKSWIPTTGHTDTSFSIEHWYSDVAQSELFTGCKIAQASIDLPPTGMATIGFDVRGKDITTATAQYYTTPTASTTSGTLAAVNGVLRVAGATVAVVTGMQITINANFTGDPVVGSNTIPNQFPGRVLVSGQLTAYFEDATFRNAFVNETEIEIIAAFTTDNTATSEFMTFVIHRAKAGGAGKDDGEKGIIQTIPFQALLNTAGGAGIKSQQTTLSVQDSLA